MTGLSRVAGNGTWHPDAFGVYRQSSMAALVFLAGRHKHQALGLPGAPLLSLSLGRLAETKGEG